MSIPIGNSYEATASGEAMKVEFCEKCHREYAYKMHRVVKGEGASLLYLDEKGASQRAAERAQDALRESLEKERDAVPCPSCGWYQEHMISIIRAKWHPWMFQVGRVALVLGVIALAAYWKNSNDPMQAHLALTNAFAIAGAALIGIGGALMAGRFLCSRLIRPNNINVETRMQIGRERATLMDDIKAATKSPSTEANDAVRAEPK